MPDPCPKCKGAKHVLTDDGYERCPCLVEEQRQRRIGRAGIPAYLADHTLKDWRKDHPKTDNIVGAVVDWIKAVAERSYPRCFCLAGQSGSGKQTLACLVLRLCIDKGFTGKIVTLDDLVQDRFEDGTLYDQTMASDVAYLRLGMESDHKLNPLLLEKVHFGRKAAKKPTLYTTRVDNQNVFERKYGKVLWAAFWQAGRDVNVWDLGLRREVVP